MMEETPTINRWQTVEYVFVELNIQYYVVGDILVTMSTYLN